MLLYNNRIIHIFRGHLNSSHFTFCSRRHFIILCRCFSILCCFWLIIDNHIFTQVRCSIFNFIFYLLIFLIRHVHYKIPRFFIFTNFMEKLLSFNYIDRCFTWYTLDRGCKIPFIDNIIMAKHLSEIVITKHNIVWLSNLDFKLLTDNIAYLKLSIRPNHLLNLLLRWTKFLFFNFVLLSSYNLEFTISYDEYFLSWITLVVHKLITLVFLFSEWVNKPLNLCWSPMLKKR